MEELEESYESEDLVPAEYKALYKQGDGGAWHFSGVKGMFGAKERQRLQQENGSWRIKHKEVVTGLDSWSALGDSPEAVRAQLDELTELKASGTGGNDDEKVQRLVEAKGNTIKAQYQRELDKVTQDREGLASRVQAYEARETQRAVTDSVMQLIQKSDGPQIDPAAIEDVMLFAERHLSVTSHHDDDGNLVIDRIATRENAGVTPDVEPDVWLREMLERKGHWLVPSQGSGANGSRANRTPGGGSNPWSAQGWNITQQGKFLKEHGREKAEQMARAAGTTLGGPRPQPKGGNQPPPTRGLRRGF